MLYTLADLASCHNVFSNSYVWYDCEQIENKNLPRSPQYLHICESKKKEKKRSESEKDEESGKHKNKHKRSLTQDENAAGG